MHDDRTRFSLAFNRAGVDALHNVFLEKQEHHDDRDAGHKYRRENKLPGVAVLTGEYAGEVQR